MRPSVLNKTSFYIAVGVFALLLATPVFYLQAQWLVGTFSLISLFGFLFLNRCCETKKQYLFLYLAFWVSFSIRFCRTLGSNVGILFAGLAFYLILSAGVAGLFLLEVYVRRTKVKFLAPLVFPLGYTAMMMICTALRCGNIFNLTASFFLISFFSNNLQWATEFGLTFAVLLVGSLLMEILFVEGWKKKVVHGAIGAAVLSGLLISGACLQSKTTTPDYTLHVALGLAEPSDFLGHQDHPYTEEEHKALFEKEVKEAAAQNADFFVVHEEFGEFKFSQEADYLAYYGDVLRSYAMPALICADEEVENGKNKNMAYFFGADGTVLSSYQKANLIPVVETKEYEGGSFSPGYVATTLAGHAINISYMICFDLNNEFFVRQVNSNTELLLVPSWDWDTNNLEQERSYVKSIECNTTLLKHTYDGFSFVSTPTGLYGDMIDNRGKAETVTMVDVPIYQK